MRRFSRDGSDGEEAIDVRRAKELLELEAREGRPGEGRGRCDEKPRFAFARSFFSSVAREGAGEGSKDEGGRRRISRRSSAFLAPAALQPGLRPRVVKVLETRLSAKPPPIRSAIDEARFDWSISRENRDFFTEVFFSVREPPNPRPSFSRCARGKIKQISVRREIAACASPARSGVGGIRPVSHSPPARASLDTHIVTMYATQAMSAVNVSALGGASPARTARARRLVARRAASPSSTSSHPSSSPPRRREER